jgi:hypothetical protein
LHPARFGIDVRCVGQEQVLVNELSAQDTPSFGTSLRIRREARRTDWFVVWMSARQKLPIARVIPGIEISNAYNVPYDNQPLALGTILALGKGL